MEKKYQVFISSTYIDLIEERQKVVESVLSAGHIPAGMELFHAGNETQKELIEEWISESDIYVLLLGGRYGSLDEDGISYTHWEYNKAKELGKPRFSLVFTEDYIKNKIKEGKLDPFQIEINKTSFIEFKDQIMSKIVSQINGIDQIEGEVLKSIHRIVKKEGEKLQGWVKGSYLKEVNSLNEANKHLSEVLLHRQEEVISMQNEINAVKDDYVGDYNFLYLKEKLSEVVIKQEDIENAIYENEKNIDEQGESIYGPAEPWKNDIKNLKALKDVNCLEWLVENKQQILTEDFNIYYSESFELIRKEFISKLDQYGLVYLDSFSSQRAGTGRILKFNENGKKFLSLLEINLPPS